MSAQFYLSLLNPVLALSFSGIIALLGRRWPSQTHFFPLSIAFLYLALGFITQEWPLFASPGGINYAGNALCYAAAVLACVSALVRVRAKVPVIPISVLIAATLGGFLFYSLVEPSTQARIYLMGGSFALLSLITLVQLISVGIRDLADRLFAVVLALGIALALGRPILLLTGVLTLNAQGGVDQSSYWGNVAGLTPLLAVLIMAAFVFALVLDIMTELRREADHDLLTGLLNRRGFDTAVTGALKENATDAALLLADIDDFKQVNDRFGHAVGDRVIAAVGTILSRHGETDSVGRVGGEEFALFYRNATAPRLEVIAHNIAAGLSNESVQGLPEGYPLTISIGLHARQGNETFHDMKILADRALYRAKAAGKNRAMVSPARLKRA
jgi:diguanylate cyclase (GGDEF)-like protein